MVLQCLAIFHKVSQFIVSHSFAKFRKVSQVDFSRFRKCENHCFFARFRNGQRVFKFTVALMTTTVRAREQHSRPGPHHKGATKRANATCSKVGFDSELAPTDSDGIQPEFYALIPYCLWILMIKIKSYVVIAFSYRKANKLRKWSEILHYCYGNKGLCHGCRSH